MLLYLLPTGDNFLMNKTGLGLFLYKTYCIHFIVAFYLFIYSVSICCKFWHLEHTRYYKMVMTSDETRIQILANWPMSHAKRVTRGNWKNPEYHVIAALRGLKDLCIICINAWSG